MSTTLEVKGLRQALENFNKLDGLMKSAIGRKALIAGSSLLRAAIQGQTYTTFRKQTGAIKAGFGTRVGHQLRGTELSAVVVQYPQSLAGLSANPIREAVLRHQRARTKTPRKIDVYQLAFWWRFLEFGTKPRRAARAPRSKRASERALARYAAAPSRGAITARSWVRPAAAANVQPAVDGFSRTMREEIEKAVNDMPK